MEPTFGGSDGDLRELRLDLLRRATEIYLSLAYPSGVIPEPVQRRLCWREDCAPDELLRGALRSVVHRCEEKPDEVVVIGGHLDSWDLG